MGGAVACGWLVEITGSRRSRRREPPPPLVRSASQSARPTWAYRDAASTGSAWDGTGPPAAADRTTASAARHTAPLVCAPPTTQRSALCRRARQARSVAQQTKTASFLRGTRSRGRPRRPTSLVRRVIRRARRCRRCVSRGAGSEGASLGRARRQRSPPPRGEIPPRPRPSDLVSLATEQPPAPLSRRCRGSAGAARLQPAKSGVWAEAPAPPRTARGGTKARG